MDELALRKKIIATAIDMNARGLNRGKSGNVSARFDDSFLVTPTGMAYESMQPVDIYAARREVGAIVHAHSPFATSIACLGRDIPPFHYMIAVAGGKDIRCAAYATFGTQQLSDHALRALDGRKACLLA